MSTLTSFPINYLVEARGDNPLGSGGVGGDALVLRRSCWCWHCRCSFPNLPGVLFWSGGVFVVKSSHSPARSGGKNTQISLGLGAGPFDGHDASLDQERGIGDQGEPLKYYDNVKS